MESLKNASAAFDEVCTEHDIRYKHNSIKNISLALETVHFSLLEPRC